MTLSFTELSSHVVTVLYIINILLACTVIFLERRNPTSTLAWILVLFLFPAGGAILYFMFSQNLTRKKMFQLGAEEHLKYAALLNKEIEDLQSGRLTFNDPAMENYKDMILLHQIQSQALFSQDNSVEIFTNGRKKFEDLFRTILEAKDHIHVLYFIIKRDSLGLQLIKILTEKAKEGLEVRLLVDSFGNKLRKDDFQPLIDAGGSVEKFFPSFLSYINLRLNYRNHRKLVIIDGQIGYIGGFNVGNEYINLKKKMGYWRDTHLKITGTAVLSMQTRFLLDWKVASGEKIKHSAKYYPEPAVVGTSGIQIVSSGPDSPHEEIKQGYIKMINSAKKSIYIHTPYFVPDSSILEVLKIAALSGVDVKIMIPNKPDHIFVYWATYSFVGELIKAGAKIYIYNNGFLHSKTIVVDKKIASVGTANFDIRSFRLNFEVNAFIYDVGISENLCKIYNEDLLLCTELTPEKYAKRSGLIKFKESISRLLAPVL
ncbi:MULTISPECIES: cardiolipin synthase [Dehalobacter]|jgi:cardiolipin synthase|uniref:Cardiolipin synthase n=2 Tax=Dehalobacter restrictus TaxID=55583 RepID=A0A857DL70_9FIRM|nr:MULTISPECIES: cardiolipin synthase [Dehalobacter]AHF10291.1 phospholipase D [Dehalobacter restrictus DSM 9455]MCG1024299.1 cardiolipin synthase [Dehalobacter sp.]OCZ49513.1 cardiolipin synthase [Dehalobacter sp. TeCB1]QHA00876.1 cardiolipin synthase [Dehalobacter restrictus]